LPDLFSLLPVISNRDRICLVKGQISLGNLNLVQ
jgi:hypothetical protein